MILFWILFSLFGVFYIYRPVKQTKALPPPSTFELRIPHGTQDDYDWMKSMLERAWYDVGVGMNGEHYVTPYVPK